MGVFFFEQAKDEVRKFIKWMAYNNGAQVKYAEKTRWNSWRSH